MADLFSSITTLDNPALASRIRKAILQYTMLRPDEKIGIALSGGKDSMTLMAMLHHMQGRGIPNYTLHAFYVAGENNCGPAVSQAHVQRATKALAIPLTILKSRTTPLACYPCARARRYALFAGCKAHNITTLAFGHHHDDHAQTVWMNLLHKGKVEGMDPKVHMFRFGITLIRPLIYVKEAQIRAYAQAQGFARLQCQCPVGQKSQRKRTQNLLSTLAQDYPQITTMLAKAGLHHYEQRNCDSDPRNNL